MSLPQHVAARCQPITHYQLLRMLDKGCRFYPVDTTKDLPVDVLRVSYNDVVYAVAAETDHAPL